MVLKGNKKGTSRKPEVANEHMDDDSDNNEFDKASGDESLDDSASDFGWDSDDEYHFSGKINHNTVDSDSGSESDQEIPKQGEILLSDLLSSSYSKLPDNNVSSDSSDEQDDDSDVQSEEDDDLNDIHSRLLQSIEKFSKTEDSVKVMRNVHSNQMTMESKSSSMLNDTEVSMNALLGALDNGSDLATIKKRLVELEKGLTAPSYVEKVVSERMERQYAYQGTKQDMNKWQETVVANRHVSVLDLAQDKRQMASYKQLINHHVPTTALEKDIQMILVKQGTSDRAAGQIETDELESRQISPEDIRQRQAELAKVKAMMFYEQMKRHRLNKIKSKAYRNIHKRQRLRKSGKAKADADGMEDEDQEDAEEQTAEMKEKSAYSRVKERMDMRHKNTSKWAKMALLHGHSDKNLRTAYHESVQLGHELTERIHGNVDGHATNNMSDDDEAVQSVVQKGTKRKSVTQDAAREMQQLLSGSGDNSAESVDGKYRKLFDMDFMKKAVDQQRERAREDAESVLREISEMDADSNSDDEQIRETKKLTDTSCTGSNKRSRSEVTEEDATRAASAKDKVQSMLGRHGQGTLMSLAGHAKQSGVKTTGSLSVEAPTVSESTSVAPTSSTAATVLRDDDDENPWLAAPVSRGTVKQPNHIATLTDSWKIIVPAIGAKQQHQQTAKATKSKKHEMISVTPTAASTATGIVKSGVTETKSTSAAVKSVLPMRAPLLMQKSQADLVKMAFAGPDLEADFGTYKDREIDGELGVDDKKMEILKSVKAGWGDWAGPGASEMVSQKILAKRDRLLTQVQSENNRSKLARKDNKMLNVLISERRIKTASKFKIADIPHPFTSWEQYERSLQMPLGEDWNAAHVVKSNTQPEIKLRAGRIVEPIKLSKQQKNVVHAK